MLSWPHVLVRDGFVLLFLMSTTWFTRWLVTGICKKSSRSLESCQEILLTWTCSEKYILHCYPEQMQAACLHGHTITTGTQSSPENQTFSDLVCVWACILVPSAQIPICTSLSPCLSSLGDAQSSLSLRSLPLYAGSQVFVPSQQ